MFHKTQRAQQKVVALSVALALWASVTAGRTETYTIGIRDVLDPCNAITVLAWSIHTEHAYTEIIH